MKTKEHLAPIWDNYHFITIGGLASLAMLPVLFLLAAPDPLSETPAWFQLFFWLNIFLLLHNLYGYYTERRFRVLANEFDQNTQKKILLNVLDELQWNYTEVDGYIKLNYENNTTAIKMVQALFLPKDKELNYNILIKGATYSNPRYPYTIGIKSWIKYKFKKAYLRNVKNYSN